MDIKIFRETLNEIGLGSPRPFCNERRFVSALLLGALFCMLWRVSSFAEMPTEPLPFGFAIIFSIIIWQPFIEEILFRGIIQGAILKTEIGIKKIAGISLANIGTSILFAAAHLFTHSPLAAISVAIPSLIFGYFRERERSTYPPIALHIAYNGFYFFTLSRFAPF